MLDRYEKWGLVTLATKMANLVTRNAIHFNKDHYKPYEHCKTSGSGPASSAAAGDDDDNFIVNAKTYVFTAKVEKKKKKKGQKAILLAEAKKAMKRKRIFHFAFKIKLGT